MRLSHKSRPPGRPAEHELSLLAVHIVPPPDPFAEHITAVLPTPICRRSLLDRAVTPKNPRVGYQQVLQVEAVGDQIEDGLHRSAIEQVNTVHGEADGCRDVVDVHKVEERLRGYRDGDDVGLVSFGGDEGGEHAGPCRAAAGEDHGRAEDGDVEDIRGGENGLFVEGFCWNEIRGGVGREQGARFADFKLCEGVFGRAVDPDPGESDEA